ncbi:MAG: hypothetical protein MZW92_47575, partial [Comamonadaceae bacterium]|nr:hypothetical protein [Comamonadaceae bacterium]
RNRWLTQKTPTTFSAPGLAPGVPGRARRAARPAADAVGRQALRRTGDDRRLPAVHPGRRHRRRPREPPDSRRARGLERLVLLGLPIVCGSLYARFELFQKTFLIVGLYTLVGFLFLLCLVVHNTLRIVGWVLLTAAFGTLVAAETLGARIANLAVRDTVIHEREFLAVPLLYPILFVRRAPRRLRAGGLRADPRRHRRGAEEHADAGAGADLRDDRLARPRRTAADEELGAVGADRLPGVRRAAGGGRGRDALRHGACAR